MAKLWRSACGVAEGRQAECAAQPRHRLLNEAGLKPLAAHADEEGIARLQPVWAGGEIVGDRFGHDG